MLEINYFFFLFKGGAADPESDLPPPLHRGRLYSLLGSFKPSQSRLGLDISPGRQHSLVRIEKIFYHHFTWGLVPDYYFILPPSLLFLNASIV